MDLQGQAGFSVDWQFPMLIAAIDPQAEARLDGLNRAVTSGQYLPENFDNANPRDHFGAVGGFFPVLAAADSGIGEESVTQVQELPPPRQHRFWTSAPKPRTPRYPGTRYSAARPPRGRRTRTC